MGRGKLVENEQTKLSATYINSAAIGVLAAGVFGPLVGTISNGVTAQPWQLAALFTGCLLISAGLHYVARRLLGSLRE
jgi:hypothetical protein